MVNESFTGEEEESGIDELIISSGPFTIRLLADRSQCTWIMLNINTDVRIS